MIRVEVDCYRRRKRNILVDSEILNSGEFKNIGFLGSARISVFGPGENRRSGKVIISGKDNGINVVRYKDEKDMDGEAVDIKRPIEVSGDEELSIFTNKRKLVKEVLVFLNPDNDDQDRNPQVIPEKRLFSPPLIAG